MQFSDILVKNALFCDETEDYRTPAEPEAGDSVVIRFRTLANNVDNVYLISRKSEIKMEKVRTEGLFDFYETQISVGSTAYLYYFEIEKGRDICYYNKLGCTTNLRQKYAFRITPAFIRQSGQRVQYFIRFMWIAFIMQSLPMMFSQVSITM